MLYCESKQENPCKLFNSRLCYLVVVKKNYPSPLAQKRLSIVETKIVVFGT